jgi:DNA-binding CsgD family transcriptional regulator
MRSSVLVGAAAPDFHESILICNVPVEPANVIVAGLPFEFRESGARAMVGSDARALWLSANARHIVESSRTLSLVDGRIVGRTRYCEQLIRAMIAEALQSHACVDQLMSPASGEAPELFVQAENRSRGGNAVVALKIRQLGRDMDHLPDLTRLFGLTRTEQKIVRLLMQGHSVRAIADQLGTSVLTARTHLKRTYAKVNVGTKEQLFSTLLKLMLD